MEKQVKKIHGHEIELSVISDGKFTHVVATENKTNILMSVVDGVSDRQTAIDNVIFALLHVLKDE